jgi:hypothetical protein
LIMKSLVSFAAIVAAACLCLPACTPAAAPVPAAADVAAAQPFEPADGERKTIMPLGAEDPQPSAFGVVKFDTLKDASKLGPVRLFGAGGGDPAANGLMTYLSIATPHDGVEFLLGDFVDYRIVASAPGRIDLEITETAIVGKDDQLGSITRRAIVSWTEKPQSPDETDPEFPTALTITPAK